MQGKTSDSREIMEIEKSCHSSFVDKFKSSTQWSTEAKKVNAVFDALVQGIVVSIRFVKCFRNFLLTDTVHPCANLEAVHYQSYQKTLPTLSKGNSEVPFFLQSDLLTFQAKLLPGDKHLLL